MLETSEGESQSCFPGSRHGNSCLLKVVMIMKVQNRKLPHTAVETIMTTMTRLRMKLTAYLGFQALIVGDQGGELARLVQAGSQQTWDLLDHCLTGQETTVLLGCRQTDRISNRHSIHCKLLVCLITILLAAHPV